MEILMSFPYKVFFTTIYVNIKGKFALFSLLFFLVN